MTSSPMGLLWPVLSLSLSVIRPISALSGTRGLQSLAELSIDGISLIFLLLKCLFIFQESVE